MCAVLLLCVVGVLATGCGLEETSGATTSSSTGASASTASSPSSTEATSTTEASAATAPQELLVATASSLKAAFTEIGAAFDKTHNAKTTFTFDASGTLQRQIEAGAPVDVFVSASPVQVNNLLKQALADEASITTFASNEIVVAVPAKSTLSITGFKDLAGDAVKKVTTADPQTAPQGQAAVEVLKSLNLYDAVQPKLVYSKNASQTLTYVVQGEVDAGIMFATDAISGGDAVQVVEASSPSWHSEIAYVAALVSNSQSKSLGQNFINFVVGPEGREILQKYGFVLP